MAILLPVIVLALFSSIQISLYFLARSEALGAAQQGVTAQRAFHAATGAGKTRADQFVAHGNGWLGAQTTTVTCTNPDPGSATCGVNSTGVLVTVTGRSISLIPGWGITVTQSAHGEIERTTTPPPAPSASAPPVAP